MQAIKRKEIENEKREESKKKTMDKLLTTKTTLPQPASCHPASSGTTPTDQQNSSCKPPPVKPPVVTYRVTASQRLLSYPEGMSYPLEKAKAVPPPPAIKCAVCKVQAKKYNCSKTKRPLCSLACYKANTVQMAAA